MSGFRAAFLIFLFCVDVHVKAEAVDCWGKTTPCSVKAVNGRRTLEFGHDWRLTMAKSSIVEQRDKHTTELILGDFYIEASTNESFKTPYGRVWCADQCKALMTRTLTEFEIKSLEGRWLVQRTGEPQTYVLATGLQLHLGEVSDDGRAAMEFPQSLPWMPTIEAWAALYPGDLKDFKPTLVKFRPVWQEAVETASQLHFQAATRTLASFERSQAENRARHQAQEREDQRLRALFRERNP